MALANVCLLYSGEFLTKQEQKHIIYFETEFCILKTSNQKTRFTDNRTNLATQLFSNENFIIIMNFIYRRLLLNVVFWWFNFRV